MTGAVEKVALSVQRWHSLSWANRARDWREYTLSYSAKTANIITGSPSSKYELRRASALLRNIQNIRLCTGKKPRVSLTYENERISIKNSLSHLKCVLRLSCVVHGPIYGRFMGFYVNGFLSIEIGFFFPIQILIFWMLRNNADARRCSYFELGLPVI